MPPAVSVAVPLSRGGRVRLRRRVLAELRLAHAVAELAGPQRATLVRARARRRGGAHPARCVDVLALPPVLPRERLGTAVVVDQQLVARVDGVGAIGERE